MSHDVTQTKFTQTDDAAIEKILNGYLDPPKY